MRSPFIFIFALLLSYCSSAQNVKEELKQLFTSLNNARMKHDRAALEKIYADEFMIVHSTGSIEDKTATINSIMTTDSIRAFPIPAFDDLLVYGDVAIYRQQVTTAAATLAGGRLFNSAIYVKRNASWQIVQLQGTPLQPEKKTTKLDAKALDAFAGTYEKDPGQNIIIERQEDILLLELVGRGIPKRRLSPNTETQFSDNVGTEYRFFKNDKGEVTYFIAKLANGQEFRWNKIK